MLKRLVDWVDKLPDGVKVVFIEDAARSVPVKYSFLKPEL